HAEFDDFKRDAATDWFLLLRYIDDSAAAFAKLLQQFVVTDAVTGFFAAGVREAHGRAWELGPYGGLLCSGWRVLQEGDRFVMNSKQGFDAQAQGRIISTGPIQIAGAL